VEGVITLSKSKVDYSSNYNCRRYTPNLVDQKISASMYLIMGFADSLNWTKINRSKLAQVNCPRSYGKFQRW